MEYEYRVLQDLHGKASVPKPLWFGRSGRFTIMVMKRYGPSLRSLLELCGGKFTLCTVIRLGGLLVDELERIHNLSYLHRSIKPDNVIMSLDGRRVVFIDFETAKQYRTHSGKHCSRESNRAMVGTRRYASPRNHRGRTLSRRDDLQSLLYTLIELRCGRLPWDGVKNKDDMLTVKEAAMKRLHAETEDPFGYLQRTISSLHFEDKPRYDAFRETFKLMRKQYHVEEDSCFDWEGRQLRSDGGYGDRVPI